MTSNALETLFSSAIRLATPLLFAALGGLLSERAGVVNIALEGILLVGAFTGAAVAHVSGSPWVGLLAGMAAGALFGLIHALLCVPGRADQIVAGTALNILAVGLTASLGKPLFGVTGSTPALPLSARFSEWHVPLLGDLPLLGPVLFQHIPLVYLAALTALGVHLLFRRTRFGLRVHAVGESPDAAAAAGLSVRRLRILSVTLGGAIAAMGGVFLSVGHASGFARNMSAGRGYIALAALILANWRPLPVLVATFVFGLGDALGILLQGVPLPGVGTVPVQFVQMLPYLLTLGVLVGIGARPRPPAALGRPWPAAGWSVPGGS